MAHLPARDTAPADVDPFTEQNPWQPPTAQENASAQRGPAPTSNTYAAGGHSGDLPPPKVINDNPPGWSGDHPERELEPYLKKLCMWLMSTRTMKTQPGMPIFNHATGDLNVIINELEVEDLISEDSGWGVFEHIQKRNEGMLQYCIRRDKLFKQLTKEGWEIPSMAKGYILLRDAHLPEKARDLIEMWTSGNYEYAEMQKYLKRLERPVPRACGARITGLVWVLENPNRQTPLWEW